MNAEAQEIITSDKLNARVDAQVYLKVKSDEESAKSSQYKVINYQYQIVNLAHTNPSQSYRYIDGQVGKRRAGAHQQPASKDNARASRKSVTIVDPVGRRYPPCYGV